MKVDIHSTDKKYQIIYADPPWEYKESGGGHRGTAGLPYKTMTTEEIAALPVSEISTDSTILYLWATDRALNCLQGSIRTVGTVGETRLRMHRKDTE